MEQVQWIFFVWSAVMSKHLMLESETISETSGFYFLYAQLITQEELIAFSSHKNIWISYQADNYVYAVHSFGISPHICLEYGHRC